MFSLYLAGGAKISFFTYNYPLIGDAVGHAGVNLASIRDIAAMKIDALAGRGAKRDFVDLYFIGQQYSLDQCLDFYLKKYPQLSENLFHVIRSLTYFAEAESPGQELTMLKPVAWEKVKKFFESEAIRLANKLL